MNYKSITLKNFKSYGNVPTRIEFSENVGELILMVGPNGAGKTSLLDAFSYVWYNVVYGRNNRRIPLAKLPNRMNGDMSVESEFSNETVQHGVVLRTASPSKVKLTRDGVPHDKAGKIQDVLNDMVGFDLDSYRSFISMSINDFKNFIELTTDDKRMLLDKLFNLEQINQLGKIIKEMKKANDLRAASANQEVTVTRREMDALVATMAKISARQEVQAQSAVSDIKEQITAHKEEYNTLAEGVQAAKDKVDGIANKLNTFKAKQGEVALKRRETERQIALYNSGKCPTCHTDLSTDLHAGFLTELNAKLEKIKNVEVQAERAIDALRDQHNELFAQQREVESMYVEIRTKLQMLSGRLREEAAKQEASKQPDTNISDLEQMLAEMGDRQTAAQKIAEDTAKQDMVFKKMTTMFSEDGIKQTIIANIVKPINAFIAENMAIVGLPHKVVLNKAFDAKLFLMGDEVDSETLSTGEAKIVNICIMLAYIKLLRTKKHINILFLDEVFASIDVSNIYLILNLLRDFARSYNVNVFLVHHSELQDSCFDRILKLNKNVFTTIEDTRNKSAE